MKLLLLTVVAVVATAAYPMHSYHIFMDCYDPICSMNGIYGFHCKNGICSYICSEAGCRQDGLVNRPSMDKSNIIFSGCKDLNCAVNGFYGYGCAGGACHYICSDSGCVDVRRGKLTPKCSSKPDQKKAEKNSKVEKENPKEVDTTNKQSVDNKEMDLKEQASTETKSDAFALVTTAAPDLREEEKEEKKTESTLPTEILTEAPAESKEASGKPNVPDDTISATATAENKVEESEVDKVNSATKTKGAEQSEEDDKSQPAKKSLRKKRLSRRVKRK
ncbi:hypothetical protein ECG_05538 [Echinococcus granulosus]|uniref:Expressed conserved protein n=1 Tax=Echinococcus granulosus TaxID=6210 RepID=A0A068WLE1_ECHGR|nr:hypothetical protein ECG_05538 [Echinococcus granulosus]CDS18440.1 expressed conserved protein [Echinococcus granulosus]